jgi:hypothetical protein
MSDVMKGKRGWEGKGEIRSGVCSCTISMMPTMAGTLQEEW